MCTYFNGSSTGCAVNESQLSEASRLSNGPQVLLIHIDLQEKTHATVADKEKSFQHCYHYSALDLELASNPGFPSSFLSRFTSIQGSLPAWKTRNEASNKCSIQGSLPDWKTRNEASNKCSIQGSLPDWKTGTRLATIAQSKAPFQTGRLERG